MADRKQVTINEFKLEDIPPSCTWIVVGNPGSGKCFKRNTKVLTFEGDIKEVQNVKIGDCLMGDDGSARKVSKLFRGEEQLYKITPADGTDPYSVTGGHTLCLRYNTRPAVNHTGGKHPRYRARYPVEYISKEKGYPLSKVKVESTGFSVIKHGEADAKAQAEAIKNIHLEKYNKKFPLHEVEVEEYLKQSATFNHRLVAYRVPVDSFAISFEDDEFDPYLLGVWLGDGYTSSPKITNGDPEIVEYLHQEAERLGLRLSQDKTTSTHKGYLNYRFSSHSGKKGDNTFLNCLRENGLIGNKHIPDFFKKQSRENRLKLLAGLLDTDGYWANGSYYEIYQKVKVLADDIVFLARSLGFWSHIKETVKGCHYTNSKGDEVYAEGTYYRVTLGGYNLHEVPMKVARKIASLSDLRKQKDPLHYKFTIEKDEVGEYFGFEVIGKNNRFLLGDFTVAHNCMAPGTPIVMFDGSIKSIENVKVGDRLMGDDSTQRTVLGTTTGEDEMYEIQQSHADNYTVNGPHKVCLRRDGTPKLKISPQTKTVKVEWVDLHGNLISEDFSPTDDELFYERVSCAVKFKDQLRNNINYQKIFVKEIAAEELAESVEGEGLVGYANPISFPTEVVIHPMDCIDLGKKFIQGQLSANEVCIVITKMSVRRRKNFLAGVLDYSPTAFQAIDEDNVEYYSITVKNEEIASVIKITTRSIGMYAVQNKTHSSSETEGDESITLNLYCDYLPYLIKLESNSIPHNFGNKLKIVPKGRGVYHGFELDGNHRYILGDFTVCRNSTFMENMAYYQKHKYPVAKVFVGTEGGYKRFSKIFHPLFVSNYYDEEGEKRHVMRQKTCDMENGKGHPANYAINIIDDCTDDPKIYRTPVMRSLFKMGSQHWHQLFMVGTQYAIDMPPDIRKSVSYIAIFFEPERLEREKLYKNFGGLAGTYDDFADLMDQLTGDYTCLIFRKRTQTTEISENVFYFRTKLMPENWKFGCNEYRKWGDSRYNKNYIDEIFVK